MPRRPKPTNLKVLHGTDRPDRVSADEPKPRPVAPKLPSGLDATAKRIWRRDAPIAERMGTLTEADVELFSDYCRACSRYDKADKRYRKVLRLTSKLGDLEWLDSLEVVRRAEVSVEKSQHEKRMLALEFGLSAAARSRINVEVKDNAEGVLEKLWSARGG